MDGNPNAEEIVAEFLGRLRAAADPQKATLFKPGSVFEPDSGRRAFWTHVMMNALLNMGRQRGFTTYPSNYYLAVDRRGQHHNSRYGASTDEPEFMIDVVWGNWGAANGWWREPRDKGTRMGVSLACESEWGWLEGGDEEHHLDATFNDFSKLVAIKSPVKLLICSSSGPPMTRELLDCTEAMAQHALNASTEKYAVLVWDTNATWALHRALPVARVFGVG